MQQLHTKLRHYHEQYRPHILLILSMLILVLGYCLLVLPLKNTRLDTASRLHSLQTQISTLRTYDMTPAEFSAKQSVLSERQQDLQTLLPNGSNNSAAIMQLTATIKAHNLNIRSVKANNPLPQNGYQLHRLDCIVSGGYFELIALFENLQKRQPFTNIQINSINLEADEKLSVSMQVHTYFLD